MYNISSQCKYVPFAVSPISAQTSADVVLIADRHVVSVSSLLQSTISYTNLCEVRYVAFTILTSAFQSQLCKDLFSNELLFDILLVKRCLKYIY